jgi:hypothetical protein
MSVKALEIFVALAEVVILLAFDTRDWGLFIGQSM